MTRFSERVIYRRLRAFINRQLGPSSLPGEGIQYWRERIFHYFSLAVVFFGVGIYLYYGLSFLMAGQYLFMAFATSVFVSSMLVVSIHTLPLSFRIGWILFILYVTGTFLLFTGPNSTMGMLFLFAAIIMGGTMSGAFTGIWYLIFSSVTLTGIGFYWYSGHIVHTNGPDISLHTFINLSIIFLVLNLITLAPLISLLNGMMFTIKKERRYQRILRREQEDLVFARQKAEESDRLKTAFLSNMSHEIRTPMNAILGFSNLLSHPGVTEREKEEFVSLIKINGKNLMSLVEDIIDISKMESGQFEIHNAPCQLHQVLEDVYSAFTDEMSRRGITNLKLYLKKGISDERIQILTDAVRLKKVLNNLVGNAIKFTDKGYIEFGYSLNNEHFIQFYVKDTGIGLPPGKEKEIFNHFSKFSQNEDKLYGGTGIGLTIARHLVKHMGGDIWVEPQTTQGTTFFFTIPFQKIMAPSQTKLQPWTNSYINWEGKTFLVAEDEEDNFRYLEVALSLFNASLIWARDGKEAVEVFKKIDNIDLVLMDIKMPGMDGYEATRQIKKINKSVPVIAQTAYAMLGERELSLNAGCDEYISKPINYQDLLDLIQRFVPSNQDIDSTKSRKIPQE